MSRRAIWIIIIVIVLLAGMGAGLLLVRSLSRVNPRAEEPTLAPVAIVNTPTTTSGLAGTTDAPLPPRATPAQPGAPDTPAPLATSTPEQAAPVSSPSPAATLAPFAEHVVQDGENLSWIALAYNVSIDAIVEANNIPDPSQISPGAVLLIPLLTSEVGVINTPTLVPTAVFEPATTATVTTAAQTAATAAFDENALPNWPPSAISGDLASNYPLVKQTGSTALLIHYQLGTYAAANIDSLAETVDRIFARLQASMNGAVPRQIDLYLGGTLFDVNPSLQGFTQSYEFRSFVLVNGAFHPGEQEYIVGHELSHVAATHILGPASSTMIHEGLATYLPQRYLTEGAGYLPIEQICAAAYQTNAFRSAGQLRQLSYGETAFGGHIRTFFNYNLSGCFVGYLLEQYGMAALDRVYDSGDYVGVYDQSLAELDLAWQASLETVPLSLDPDRFVTTVEEIAAAYESYIIASAGGYHANYDAYLHLNRARLEANRGNLDAAQQQLEQFRTLFGNR